MGILCLKLGSLRNLPLAKKEQSRLEVTRVYIVGRRETWLSILR
jgi:hypothetical protein